MRGTACKNTRTGAASGVTADDKSTAEAFRAKYDAIAGTAGRGAEAQLHPWVARFRAAQHAVAAQLRTSTRSRLDAPFTAEELRQALAQCPSGKAPGNDRLTYDLYRSTWVESRS